MTTINRLFILQEIENSIYKGMNALFWDEVKKIMEENNKILKSNNLGFIYLHEVYDFTKGNKAKLPYLHSSLTDKMDALLKQENSAEAKHERNQIRYFISRLMTFGNLAENKKYLSGPLYDLLNQYSFVFNNIPSKLDSQFFDANKGIIDLINNKLCFNLLF